jgi:hypothetical protein
MNALKMVLALSRRATNTYIPTAAAAAAAA